MTAPAKPIPQIHSGDRMTRFEFHRRYKLHPEIRKAELIEGVVVVGSPVSRRHALPHTHVMRWLGKYCDRHLEVELLDNMTTVLDTDNEFQPDALLRVLAGGTSVVDEEHYIVGPPELAVEIAVSSVSIDLHAKKEAYRRNGVGEYIVWRVEDEAIDWFRLEEGTYLRVEPDADGIIESVQFPGLRLDVEAMIAGDLAAVGAAVR
jgi:Uma2 family endonuclease